LRALENAIQIAVVKVDYDSIGVDMPEDVAKVEKALKKLSVPIHTDKNIALRVLL
jgi:CMP-2-keto-3-deoxyoctulosonic acid synthetase